MAKYTRSNSNKRYESEMTSAQRRALMKEQKRRQMRFRKLVRTWAPPIIALLIIVLVVSIVVSLILGRKQKEQEAALQAEIEAQEKVEQEQVLQEEPSVSEPVSQPISPEPEEVPSLYKPTSTPATINVNVEDMTSEYAVMIDPTNNSVVAQKNRLTRISPASMTKILTVLVAAEHISNLDDQVTITLEYTDYAYHKDCSAAGFLENEVVTVRDLFYGTILPSGADAAVALACYVAGSHEAFVDMMNDKVAQMGLSSSSHFTNCVGLYDESHYSTVTDMAMFLKAAMENEICREVLGTRIYTTSHTEQHPDGIELSNWFLRRIEDKDTKGDVIGAKTGFVVQSGSCAASYERTNSGKEYIVVTGNAHSAWRCIYDHVAMYQHYAQ